MQRRGMIAILSPMLLLLGCALNTALNHVPRQDQKAPKKLVVFLDGTANDEGSHTNIAKLHNLVTLQSRTDISTTYIEGVGTGGKVIGMAMGWGIGHDVREAYRYLGENYNSEAGDEIYIFGFSRGAFAARILAALIHVAGVTDLRDMPDRKEKTGYVKKIYDAYKGKKSLESRRSDVAEVTRTPPMPVTIEFMGLWDTVEALGLPDYEENTGVPNSHYADQLCNVRKAAHALSIDDDRARIFTPILLTRKHLTRRCQSARIDDIVEEVWFSGAHADVGGGYKDTDIDGVSLNWMLSQIEPYALVPKGTEVYADPFGTTHDPETGWFGLIYRRVNRDLPSYAVSDYNQGRLKIHRSVLDRLACEPVKWHESNWFKQYDHCFPLDGDEPRRAPNEDDKLCFEVVDDGYEGAQCRTTQ